MTQSYENLASTGNNKFKQHDDEINKTLKPIFGEINVIETVYGQIIKLGWF